MARNLNPKCKQCRREGEKLFLKGERCFSPKCAMIKRNYPPGVHGAAKGRSRISDYGRQLREKQKAKRIYGILERQFRKYFQEAFKKKGDTAEKLIQILELRLDNVIYKLGFAHSRAQARQLVTHNFFQVNGKKVNIPSYSVRPLDIITFNPAKLKSSLLNNLSQKLVKQELPQWLFLDAKKLEAKVTGRPQAGDLKQSINAKLIVEYYSR